VPSSLEARDAGPSIPAIRGTSSPAFSLRIEVTSTMRGILPFCAKSRGSSSFSGSFAKGLEPGDG
jgi:hypothetical protein